MTWRVVEQCPPKPVRTDKRYRNPSTTGYQGHKSPTTTTGLTVWKCDGCGFYACGGADSPGPCGNSKCRFGSR